MVRITGFVLVGLLLTSLGASAGTRSALREQPHGAAQLFVLRHPIDPRQQTSLRFGERSHWLQPWRAYLDTIPGTRLLAAVGINFNVAPGDAPATARLLAGSGFRRARVEVGWGSFSYLHPERLANPGRLGTILRALKAEHIRPLILLNANDRQPCPTRFFDAHVIAPAARGDHAVRVDASTAGAIVPGKTGLDLSPEGKAAEIVITAVAADGTATLSKPLPEGIAPGAVPAATLLYAPFRRPKLADGSPNPAFEETLRGWLQYVQAAVETVKGILGSTAFDVEIWNELSFGSDFLNVDTYYEQPIDVGGGDTTDEILRRTVAWLRTPGRGYGRIGIANGFASQRPWDSGARSPVGLTAIAKHPYAPPQQFPRDATFTSTRPVDALGRPDGTRDAASHWHDRFVPRYTAFMPEYALTAIQTEHLVRDLSPITTTVYGVPHGRYTHPPGAAPPQTWITEWNLDPGELLGSSRARPLTPSERHVQAKAALRALVAYVNKGAGALFYYAARDLRLGLIDPRRSDGGETIVALHRLLRGFDGAVPLRHTRRLSLLEIGDFTNAVQFHGDGTQAHPPLYDRDVIAFFPFQLTSRRFAIATYVMTRNVARRYRAVPPGSEFDLPPLPFRLVIGGLGACNLRVRMTDPLLQRVPPVRVVACTRRALTVDVTLTDSPRLLQIER